MRLLYKKGDEAPLPKNQALLYPFSRMGLHQEDIMHLAELARLKLDDEEQKRAEHELHAILGFVDRLQKVNTEGVEPQSMPATNSWRPDEASPCDDLTRELILSNFPMRMSDLLRVPPVFENPKG